MPRGDKRHYTDKQERRAEHIEKGYEKRGTPKKEAKRRAWATVNAISRGGEKRGGSGYGKKENHAPMRRGGKRGGAKTSAARSRGARKAAATRSRNAASRSRAARKGARARAS